MMLILGLLLCISQVRSQSADTVFVFTKEEATGVDTKWTWEIERKFDLAANERLELTINTQGITGTLENGDVVTLGDHWHFEGTFRDDTTYSSNPFMVAGGLAECDDETKCGSTAYVYKCDFSTSTDHKSTIVNGKTAQSLTVTFMIKGNDNFCESVDEITSGLANWAKMVLIITIVTLVLCVLCVILVCCGVVKCCCVQQQPNTVVVETAKY